MRNFDGGHIPDIFHDFLVDHWRISCYCWAMYLRILRRWVEHGEFVPYEKRLDV